MINPTFIGIDVSKLHLDVHVLPTGKSKRFANTPKGIETLKAFVGKPKRIVLEPSGGYERLVLQTLARDGFTVCLVNAAHIRHFAQSFGELAKTDNLDAKFIAKFAQDREPSAYILPSQTEQRLRMLSVRRRQLVEMAVEEKNRLEKAQFNEEKSFINEMIANLNRQQKIIEKLMSELVEAEPILKAKIDVLTSLKGIGLITAAVLIAELPELGRLGKNAVSKLAGVAPFNKQSGLMVHKARTYAGRRVVCQSLFLNALSAIRTEPQIQEFYKRLRTKGKPGKVAVIAAVHKIIIILNARMAEFYRLHS
jgi:transposase